MSHAADSRAEAARPETAPDLVTVDAPPRKAIETAPPSRSAQAKGVSGQFLIAREWKRMPAVLAISLGIVALFEGAAPSLQPMLLMAVAMGMPFLTRRFAEYERVPGRPVVLRYAAVIAMIVVPLLLFGAGMAIWAVEDEAWVPVVGSLAICGGISSLILSGRLPSMIAAQLALWTGVCVVSGSLSGLLALGIGCLIGVYAAKRQAVFDRMLRTRQEEIERVQVRAEHMLNEYEQMGQGWFWETDRRGVLTYVSAPIGEVLERDSSELVGRPFSELFILDGHQESERTLNFHLSVRSAFQELAVRAASAGDERWWSISGRPVLDRLGNFVGFRGWGRDLTAQRRAQENETKLAHYDSLTSLANRFQMSQTLEKILNAHREEQRACAVLLLDLDRFKQVNDTMGHPAGDALLTQVAQRLEHTVDKAGRVGRLGGDEFQVIMPGRIARKDIAVLADQIIANLSQPYSIEGHRVVIGVSIGIAVSPDDGVTSEALIRNADLALYAAKDGGRGRHHFYAADLHTDAEERRHLEQELRDALANGGLELYYQPVVQTTTEKITGFEALLRWNHPVLGWMSPGKFIPIAEDAGLIGPIGEWALRTACSDLAKWPESVRVAVNVSPLQFANPALPAIVTNALAAAQVAPARLELEITESVFLNDGDETDAMFAALKRVGVRLALDDFGTGYSSLGYLRRAPFDKIKIDQSFVRGATMRGSRNGAIISAIVSLAEALGMETTAEGVETLDELDLVRMLGCSHVQGYIYEKPLSLQAASARLANGLVAIAQGPRAARATRQTMLRKVRLEHAGEVYNATIRNISATGALIEGLWNVPTGTIFVVELAEDHRVTATARWCKQDRVGVEFAVPLPLDEKGRVLIAGHVARDAAAAPFLKAG